MAKNFYAGGLDGLYSFMSQYEQTLRKINGETYSCLLDTLSRTKTPELAVTDAVAHQAKALQTLDLRIYEQPTALDAISKQWDTLARIAEGFQTPEIVRLQESLLRSDFTALQTFANSLSEMQYIEAPNIALLKMARAFDDVKLPRGLSSVVSSLHVDTAKRLVNSESVSFDRVSKMFYVESSPSDTATVLETNILCSSLEMLSDVDEADLISFLNYLSKYPNLALDHDVGKKIKAIISSWDTFMSFDCDYYYHARTLKQGECPYTEVQLLKAPSGVTWHGRYNFIGESHYYFSDKLKGACVEVGKHSNESRIQIARLKPVKTIKMIDLSEEYPIRNKFLEYCRFSPAQDDYSKVKREYLLPCFVANCCKANGIEGIKYYGSKEYTNYVAWNDGYFDFIDSELRE